MELPLHRLFDTEGSGGGRKPTHDFLSLCSHSTNQQDPKPPSQSGKLKTHDFLRPLERVGKTAAKEASNEISAVDKSPPLAPPTSAEHISFFNHTVPKPEGTMFAVAQASSTDYKNEENSNCTSYTAGSGFTLWEQSVPKKGQSGKENVGERSIAVSETVGKTTGWMASDRPSQSSSNNHRNRPQKSQSFMEIIKSAKGSTQDDDLGDKEEIVLKKECPSPTVHKANEELRIKVEGMTSDQKVNTPRSKHSATEQRRRSKINDRFQMLRELIPHGDQKRDKASFLLEVIEHIQFLQEKVKKYEGSDQGWNQEPAKLKNSSLPGESYMDQSRGISGGVGPGLHALDDKNIMVSPTIPGNAHKLVESDLSSAATFKAMDQHPGITNKAMSFPVSLPPNFFLPGRSGGAVAQFGHRMTSDAENKANQPQTQSCLTTSCATDGLLANDNLEEQDLTIEGGKISISSAYSQGLLSTLTQVLHSSGVDLSQASISVQIELGKQVSGSPVGRRLILKDNEIPSGNQKATCSRNSSDEESDPSLKKLKTITS